VWIGEVEIYSLHTPPDNVAPFMKVTFKIGGVQCVSGSRGRAGEDGDLVADEDYQLLVTAVIVDEELGYPKRKRIGLIMPELVRGGTIVEPN
jgi:hypothetical protein